MLDRIYQTLNSQFLRGFGFGIVLTGVILLIRTVAPLKQWVIISLSAVLVLALGALIFHLLSTAAKKRVQSNLSVLAEEYALDLNDLVASLRALLDPEKRPEALHYFRERSDAIPELIKEGGKALGGMAGRFFAFSSLIAIFGCVVSAALFAATFLQVERLTEQNALLGAQRELADQAQKTQISLSIGEQQQSVVENLLSAIERELGQMKPDGIPEGNDRPPPPSFKIQLSSSLYTRIETTLGQFPPYFSVDPISFELAESVSSPQQIQLVEFLAATQIDLDGSHVFLSDTFLRRINLSGANLEMAFFAGADLEEANLSEAALKGTDFTEANLKNSDLTDATMENTIFDDADLSYSEFMMSTILPSSFNNADVKYANFFATRTYDGFADDIKKARNWEKGVYTESIASELGIPPEVHEANKEAHFKERIRLGETIYSNLIEPTQDQESDRPVGTSE